MSPEPLGDLAANIRADKTNNGGKGYNADARTSMHAVESGKIRPDDVPGLKAKQAALIAKYGEMDISVMSQDGAFVLEPSMKL